MFFPLVRILSCCGVSRRRWRAGGWQVRGACHSEAMVPPSLPPPVPHGASELSQEAFAKRVGVHRTYMGGLERGERNLTLRSSDASGPRGSASVQMWWPAARTIGG